MSDFGDQQRLAQTGVGQYEVVVDLEQHQLIPQALFAPAQRVDSASDRRDALTDIEVEPLDKGSIDGPATGRQHLLDRHQCAEHHPVLHANQAPPADRYYACPLIP